MKRVSHSCSEGGWWQRRLSGVRRPTAMGPNDGGHRHTPQWGRMPLINTTWWGVWVSSDVHQNGICFFFSPLINEKSVKLIGQNCRGIYWLFRQKNEASISGAAASTWEGNNMVFWLAKEINVFKSLAGRKSWTGITYLKELWRWQSQMHRKLSKSRLASILKARLSYALAWMMGHGIHFCIFLPP